MFDQNKYDDIAEDLSSVACFSVGGFGVWAVNKQKEVFRKESSGWTPVSGQMEMVSVGKNTVWGLNDGNVYKKMNDTDWIKVPGPEYESKGFSV